MTTSSKVLCPNCGTELEISLKQSAKSSARINALRKAGVDVSNLFAIYDDKGDEFIARNENGLFTMVMENDPILLILQKGTIPNGYLYRRWVMGQMFNMLYLDKIGHVSMSDKIRSFGYEYQWKMLINELKAQVKMYKHGDLKSFKERNRWFNKSVVLSMVRGYIKQLKQVVKQKPVKKYKGALYKSIGGKNIFLTDIQKEIFQPLNMFENFIKLSNDIETLYKYIVSFNKSKINLDWDTKQHPEWLSAYKGAGAYFTLQNMINFHNCFIYEDCYRFDKQQSLNFIDKKAEEYCNGEGWRMLGLLKKCIKDNNINVEEKIASWRKKNKK